MTLPTTEDRDPQSIGLSTRPDEDVLAVILQRQVDALEATRDALPQISAAAASLHMAADTGGKIGYAGAGSAGLMALTDCLELPGTFGFPADRMRMLYAGGAENLLNLAGVHEDDMEAGRKDFEGSGLGAEDVLIAVSASGKTPYTLAAVQAANSAGTVTIGIANNANTPLLHDVTHAILLETPPEIIAGSTRLGAASAQKAALNMMSTLVALRLGHAVRGHMVNLVADNDKLRQRAQRILMDLTDCTPDAAADALHKADGRVKTAILMVLKGLDVDAADAALARSDGNLRPFL